MPKVKSNQTRVRKIRTPNSELLTKYEQIALLSAIYSQSIIVEKVRCSYGTIKSALDYFKSIQNRESEFEWVMDVDNCHAIQIRMQNWTNRNTTYSVDIPLIFNQYLVDQISENPNKSFNFRLQYQNHLLFNLSIIELDDLNKIFQALIGKDGLNPILKERYNNTITLSTDRMSMILSLKDEFITQDEQDFEEKGKKKPKIGKSKIIATNEGMILL